MDHFFGADVVADEVFVAGEEDDGHVCEEVGEEVDGGFGVSCAEGGGDGAGAFDPAGLFVGVDVEGFEHVFAAEVRGHVDEVWRPVHAAGWVGVVETHVVHVEAVLGALGTRFCDLEDVLEDALALRDVDVVGAFLGEGLGADGDLLFEGVGGRGAGLDETFFVGEGEVGEVLWGGVDPAVADEEAFDVPLGLGCGFGVAVEDGLRDVGDVLARVGFAGDVELGRVSMSQSYS